MPEVIYVRHPPSLCSLLIKKKNIYFIYYILSLYVAVVAVSVPMPLPLGDDSYSIHDEMCVCEIMLYAMNFMIYFWFDWIWSSIL